MGYSFLRKAVALKIDFSVSKIQFPHPNFLTTEEETKKGLKKMAKYETLIPRFVSYVKKNTRSDENSTTIPSTQSQVEFAKDLFAALAQL